MCFFNLRVCRWKHPTNPRKQHWKSNASEHGLDSWHWPWTRRERDSRANTSHPETKRTWTWIQLTEMHFGCQVKVKIENNLKRQELQTCIICYDQQIQLFFSQRSLKPVCFTSATPAASTATVTERRLNLILQWCYNLQTLVFFYFLWS